MFRFLVFSLTVWFSLIWICNGTTFKTSSNYVLVESQKNANDANNYCVNYFGTKLASIHNQQQLTEITNILQGQRAFIGLYVFDWKSAPNSFKNRDGTNFDYGTDIKGGILPWGAGEPNNAGAGLIPEPSNSEGCVEVDSAGHFNDIPCSASLYFVCNAPAIIVKEALNFEAADNKCQQLYGSNLISVTNQEMNDYIKKLCINHSCWIGLQRTNPNSPWHYEDPNTPPFSSGSFGYCAPAQQNCGGPWCNGEPNNHGHGGIEEECLEIWSCGWNDLNCNEGRYFICQRSQITPSLSVPLPDTNPKYFNFINNNSNNNNYYYMILLLFIYPIFISFVIILIYRLTCYKNKTKQKKYIYDMVKNQSSDNEAI